ncbi:MAG: L,D-transpeptidase [Chloroflexi bacterium]|uniref:L,D-transpeptidase n=1 Tax=Candidatus Chlorohelix allophototropha TaxID=3003348 RepID=A0A8T7M418_9CHLR|nr:L,D-transpeptidase [Chloroflexota bacterium]WJW70186.1 L,D-transpeptidase [Chloroflexota bacterium L227-S17]
MKKLVFSLFTGLLVLGGVIFLGWIQVNESRALAPSTQVSATTPVLLKPTLVVSTTTDSPETQPPTPEATPTTIALATPETTPTPELNSAPTPLTTTEPTPVEDIVTQGLVATPPVEGKWIDLNLTDGTTRLLNGRELVKALPSAWGEGEPGTATDFYATVPGTYTIYSRSDTFWYDYNYSMLWIYGFIGFDPERANGFHSFLYNNNGNVVDSRLGPVSHGCVRVEDWRAVYDFSEYGMTVIVHGKPPRIIPRLVSPN